MFQLHIQWKFVNNISMNAWNKFKNTQQLDLFSEDYKSFLSSSKTERECIDYFAKMLEEKGFNSLENLICSKSKLEFGDKIYAINMNKALVAFKIGSRPIEEGLNIICAHIDSPRLDLKSNPLYESDGFCLFDTHYYGGIKHYQWTTLPLALHGLICKTNGKKIDFVIGEKDDEPVFGVTDLLPHLSKKVGSQGGIGGEVLNLIIGNKQFDGSVKKEILQLLKMQDIEEKDFASAEIEAVPAGKARDFGLDGSMIMGYGHDDRSCSYCAVRALIDCQTSERTLAVILVDKEEVGSMGATGMKSRFFENMLAEVMSLSGAYKELSLKRALNKSTVISADVTAGFDPNWPEPSNKKTEAFLSRGISFSKYGGKGGKSDSNDTNPEFIARLRNIAERYDIAHQFTEMGKVDQGGGGTIASILAEYGMQVIDAGLPVLSMHAPWEVISKLDLYENYRFYTKFLEENFNQV